MNHPLRPSCFFSTAFIQLPLAIISACICCPSVAAQSRTSVLRVEVNLQTVDVQVKDSHGNDVAGLSANDFAVLENGKPQRIAFFDAGSGSVSLVVMVDSSESVSSNGNLGSAEEVAAQFMQLARPDDEIWAMDFTDQMGPFERLTREQLLNPAGFHLTPAPSRGSALYDAIATALCHLRTAKNPRQAVIVVTDGVDEYSRLTLDQLIGLVRSSRAQLFMIGLQSQPYFRLGGRVGPTVTLITGRDIDNPVVVFADLMKESGAESFIPNSDRSFREALKAVSDMLQSEYTLGYYPENAARDLRKIEVKVHRRGMHVLSRRFAGTYQGAADLVGLEKGGCIVSPKEHPYPYESKITHGPNGLIYHEDFLDSRSGWPNHKNSHYLSGAYELFNPEVAVSQAHKWLPGGSLEETTTTTFQPNLIAAYGPWWDDFRASVTTDAVLKKISPEASAKYLHNSQPAAGLLFRMAPDGYYALLIKSAKSEKEVSAELVKRSIEGNSYAETAIVPWTTVAQPPTPETELSVEAVGSRITIFVNGKETMSIEDDTFGRGLVGFVITGPGRATFRNLVVEQK